MAYRFLIVDDTNFMRKMAVDCLNQFGYEVAGEAGNGKEAVRLYEELRPDVVLMDLTMPEMNGTEALKRILEIDPEAVVLICSASNQQEQIMKALEAGAKGYLLKPFNPNRLQEIIKKYAEPFLAASDSSAASGLNGPSGIPDSGAVAERTAEPAAELTILTEAETVKETVERNTTMITNRTRGNKTMKSFVSSLLCNWEEEGEEGTIRYSVICTESENKLLIEMKDAHEGKQAISFSIDGFRHLAGWLDDHVGARTDTARNAAN